MLFGRSDKTKNGRFPSLSINKCLHFSGLFLTILLASFSASAEGTLVDGQTLEPLSVQEALAQIPPGSVLVVGENHGVAQHQAQHMQILQGLRDLGHKVSVGLEFFESRFQPLVDQWRRGRLDEVDFLAQIGWGGISFDYYRPQALFPREEKGEQTVALNANRTLTSRISRVGLESLSAEERALLPPDFSEGRQEYRRRFYQLMSSHVQRPELLQRYFQAQSLWDDEMAYRAALFKHKAPQQTLVIIVGEFHVHYGGGLPDRLRARGLQNVFTISQLQANSMTTEELQESLRPEQGEARAHWIWY